jgi:D-alanyl-lipoteichoic acid acyltransferase DltB (MBOAT superfamily)
MIFNSVTFLLFLVTVTVAYWLLPNRIKIWLLFISSILFYAFWKVPFVSLMLISAANDFFLSKLIYRTAEERQKKTYLIISLCVNLGLLVYFKYLYFFAASGVDFINLFGAKVTLPYFEIILPLGISFYTFQTISYTIDVYRGFLKPVDDFVLYGSYVMFFPQLVAGPILRAGEVVEQLSIRPKFRLAFIAQGLERILFGLFLKVVLADNIAGLVDEGFAIPPGQLSGIDVWTLAFLFGFQIYFDFSAYSHIAIGSAKMMGIDFPENFNFPYAAKSFKVFWKRWHISLSSWIRDYLYLPLMGAKVHDRSTGGLGESLEQNKPTWRDKAKALFLTWAIMGLWHGANWTFVCWGVYHAMLIFFERLLSPVRRGIDKRYRSILGWCITLPLAMLGWIPFRAQNLSDVGIMFSKVVNPFQYTFLGIRENTYLITALMLVMTTGAYLIHEYLGTFLERRPVLAFPVNVVKFAIIIMLVFTFLRPISQFIYFQF